MANVFQEFGDTLSAGKKAADRFLSYASEMLPHYTTKAQTFRSTLDITPGTTDYEAIATGWDFIGSIYEELVSSGYYNDRATRRTIESIRRDGATFIRRGDHPIAGYWDSLNYGVRYAFGDMFRDVNHPTDLIWLLPYLKSDEITSSQLDSYCRSYAAVKELSDKAFNQVIGNVKNLQLELTTQQIEGYVRTIEATCQHAPAEAIGRYEMLKSALQPPPALTYEDFLIICESDTELLNYGTRSFDNLVKHTERLCRRLDDTQVIEAILKIHETTQACTNPTTLEKYDTLVGILLKSPTLKRAIAANLESAKQFVFMQPKVKSLSQFHREYIDAEDISEVLKDLRQNDLIAVINNDTIPLKHLAKLFKEAYWADYLVKTIHHDAPIDALMNSPRFYQLLQTDAGHELSKQILKQKRHLKEDPSLAERALLIAAFANAKPADEEYKAIRDKVKEYLQADDSLLDFHGVLQKLFPDVEYNASLINFQFKLFHALLPGTDITGYLPTAERRLHQKIINLLGHINQKHQQLVLDDSSKAFKLQSHLNRNMRKLEKTVANSHEKSPFIQYQFPDRFDQGFQLFSEIREQILTIVENSYPESDFYHFLQPNDLGYLDVPTNADHGIKGAVVVLNILRALDRVYTEVYHHPAFNKISLGELHHRAEEILNNIPGLEPQKNPFQVLSIFFNDVLLPSVLNADALADAQSHGEYQESIDGELISVSAAKRVNNFIKSLEDLYSSLRVDKKYAELSVNDLTKLRDDFATLPSLKQTPAYLWKLFSHISPLFPSNFSLYADVYKLIKGVYTFRDGLRDIISNAELPGLDRVVQIAAQSINRETFSKFYNKIPFTKDDVISGVAGLHDINQTIGVKTELSIKSPVKGETAREETPGGVTPGAETPGDVTPGEETPMPDTKKKIPHVGPSFTTRAITEIRRFFQDRQTEGEDNGIINLLDELLDFSLTISDIGQDVLAREADAPYAELSSALNGLSQGHVSNLFRLISPTFKLLPDKLMQVYDFLKIYNVLLGRLNDIHRNVAARDRDRITAVFKQLDGVFVQIIIQMAHVTAELYAQLVNIEIKLGCRAGLITELFKSQFDQCERIITEMASICQVEIPLEYRFPFNDVIYHRMHDRWQTNLYFKHEVALEIIQAENRIFELNELTLTQLMSMDFDKFNERYITPLNCPREQKEQLVTAFRQALSYENFAHNHPLLMNPVTEFVTSLAPFMPQPNAFAIAKENLLKAQNTALTQLDKELAGYKKQAQAYYTALKSKFPRVELHEDSLFKPSYERQSKYLNIENALDVIKKLRKLSIENFKKTSLDGFDKTLTHDSDLPAVKAFKRFQKILDKAEIFTNRFFLQKRDNLSQIETRFGNIPTAAVSVPVYMLLAYMGIGATDTALETVFNFFGAADLGALAEVGTSATVGAGFMMPNIDPSEVEGLIYDTIKTRGADFDPKEIPLALLGMREEYKAVLEFKDEISNLLAGQDLEYLSEALKGIELSSTESGYLTTLFNSLGLNSTSILKHIDVKDKTPRMNTDDRKSENDDAIDALTRSFIHSVDASFIQGIKKANEHVKNALIATHRSEIDCGRVPGTWTKKLEQMAQDIRKVAIFNKIDIHSAYPYTDEITQAFKAHVNSKKPSAHYERYEQVFLNYFKTRQRLDNASANAVKAENTLRRELCITRGLLSDLAQVERSLTPYTFNLTPDRRLEAVHQIRDRLLEEDKTLEKQLHEDLDEDTITQLAERTESKSLKIVNDWWRKKYDADTGYSQYRLLRAGQYSLEFVYSFVENIFWYLYIRGIHSSDMTNKQTLGDTVLPFYMGLAEEPVKQVEEIIQSERYTL